MNAQKKWDQAASDYQRVFRLGLSEYNSELIRFWQEKGMLFPGARVIDIGCGVGRYGTYFAELGCNVTLVDISGEMLLHAEKNMSRYKTPWAAYRCDFNEVTGEEPVFAGGFDLTISTMSPAVHDAETVRKMSRMTRGWCFLARFADWNQPFRDQLMRQLGIQPRRLFGDLKADCSGMIHAVSEAGYTPEVLVVDYNWADSRTPEEMADYMYRNYFSEEENKDSLYSEALHMLKDLTGTDGKIIDRVNTKAAWIYWKTE